MERYLSLSIADTDDATCKGHLIDSQLIGRSTAHGFDDNIRTKARCHFQQTSVDILSLAVDSIACTHLTSQDQFVIINIDSHNGSTALGRTDDSAHSHHATAYHHDDIYISDLGTADGVESHAHGLNQSTGTRCQQTCGNDFLPRQNEVFTHGSPALHSQCLIMLTGVYTTVPAGCTFAAVGIRIDRNGHTRFQSFGHVLANADNLGTYLMTWHNRHLHHRVTTAEGAEVATTETYILHLQ